jgi:hypothetical protein
MRVQSIYVPREDWRRVGAFAGLLSGPSNWWLLQAHQHPEKILRAYVGWDFVRNVPRCRVRAGSAPCLPSS